MLRTNLLLLVIGGPIISMAVSPRTVFGMLLLLWATQLVIPSRTPLVQHSTSSSSSCLSSHSPVPRLSVTTGKHGGLVSFSSLPSSFWSLGSTGTFGQTIPRWTLSTSVHQLSESAQPV